MSLKITPYSYFPLP